MNNPVYVENGSWSSVVPGYDALVATWGPVFSTAAVLCCSLLSPLFLGIRCRVRSVLHKYVNRTNSVKVDQIGTLIVLTVQRHRT
jgi:hypothetical protein